MSAERAPLRLLLVEDNPDDAAVILLALRRAGIPTEPRRVDTPGDLRAALARGGWDLVISDYHLPEFNGPEAHAITRQVDDDIPFILVSGAVGEATVVEAMRLGIDDYLMKDNLKRLPSAVERAIQARDERRARRAAEASIQRRDAILSAIGLAARRLMAALDWREQIEAMLEEIGTAADVDRAYLLSLRGDGQGLAGGHVEWAGPGAEPRAIGPDLQGFAELLGEGEPLYGPVDGLPPALRSRLQERNVQSIAIVPIEVDGKPWGTIGFDVCRARREWSTVELEALRIAADTIGAAIKRAQVKANLNLQLERLNALRKIDRAIAASLDLQVTLDVVLDQVTRMLDVTAASILLLSPETHEFEYAAGRGVFDHAFRRAPVRLGEGHAGRAALERCAVHVLDLHGAAPARSREALMPRELAEYHALPLIAKNEVRGVLEIFCGRSSDPDEEWRDFAATLAGQAAIAIDNSRMLAELTQSNADLRLAYETTLEGWSRALDLRDNETQGHTARVAALTVVLGRSMGMSSEEIVHLRRGALLHDIGKMGIPDAILHKPGPLDEEEWEVMRRHPVYAYELLSPISYLRPALVIPHLHHERWDGSGYPLGLRGEEIPLAARVFAVVDVWDALTSARPYRGKVAEERVREIIREGAGTDFDPRVVEAFLRLDLARERSSLQAGGAR
ncbi:MAG TPA: HD domain-containing phosphohydrolase [Gemmatimonadota bacterium]|nr:HD domain-containing phosphohydrolase [Gemmatimonadota bacterium]